MKNYGDICLINGGEVEAVDCVIGGSPCFPGGTMIMTAGGQKPIEDVLVGDLVYTHRQRYRRVLSTGTRKASLVKLTDGVHDIICTAGHPFYSKYLDGDDTLWTPAMDMFGMRWAYVDCSHYNEFVWIEVKSVKDIHTICPVYNLEVEEDNSYVAENIVVHNCQNLSVAGNRRGLEGSESRLFLEQMRVIKEMRQATEFQKPRYMVWENVCFRKGTFVTLKEGFKPIEQVCKGDFVKTHTGEYRQVLETFETEAQPLMWVNLHSNHKVFCTHNHPFLTLSESYSGVEWKPASSLTVNDFIAYKLDGFGTKSIGISEAWAVGRWLADGSLSDRHSKGHGNGSRGGQRYRLFFSCGYNKRDVLKAHLEQLDFSVRENAMKHAVNFTITSDAFYELISTCGRGAANKRLPEYTFSLVKEEQEALLDGYLSGDGYYRDGGEITFCSVSKQLAYGIARLVRNVYHVPCSLSHRDPVKNPTVCGRNVTSLPSFAGSFRKTYHTPSKRFIYKDDSDTLFVRVRGVGSAEICETVYNLSVDDDNSYEVEGVSVHNCGSLSCNKGKDFQCVLNECVETALLGKINLNKGTKDGEENSKEEDSDGRETGIPDVPMPKDGKWPKSGILYDDMGRWSIAWRIHDAQYWGVAQRRRRIALVVDFGGMSAPEVLLEPKSVQRDFDTCDAKGEGTSKASDGSTEKSDYVWDARGNGNGRCSATLTGDHDRQLSDYTNVVVTSEPCRLESNQNHATVTTHEESFSINGDAHDSGVSVMSEVSHALKTTTKESVFVKQSSDDVTSEPSYPCICIGNGQAHVTENYTEEISQTLNCMHDPMTILEPCAYQLVGVNSNSMKSSNPTSGCYETEQAGTITTNGCVPNNQGGTAIMEPVSNSGCRVAYDETESSAESHPVVVDRAAFNQGKNAQYDIKMEETETVPTIVAKGPHAVAQPVQYRVRRLTPLECTRLQGFPDGWVDIGDWIDSKGKKHKEADAPKYKALGNSIALPFWKWLCKNLVNQLKKDGQTVTMASLFDGIGGFPLCWTEATQSKESVLWVSEIEEFPLAVTRHHFS